MVQSNTIDVNGVDSGMDNGMEGAIGAGLNSNLNIVKRMDSAEDMSLKSIERELNDSENARKKSEEKKDDYSMQM